GKPVLSVSLTGPNGYQRTARRPLDTILPGDTIAYPMAWPDVLQPGDYSISVSATPGSASPTGAAGVRTVSAHLGTALAGVPSPGVVTPAPAPAPAKHSGGGFPMWIVVVLVAVLGAGGATAVRHRASRCWPPRAVRRCPSTASEALKDPAYGYGRPMSPGTLGRTLGAVVLLAAAVAAHDGVRRPAGALTTAPVANVQMGPVVKTTTASVTLTLPAASTAGTLLVATVASNRNSAFSSPGTGWSQAAQIGQLNAAAGIWYYADNPGGISSVTFTDTSGTSTAGQLSEWRGVLAGSPVDKTGTKTATLLATSVTPSAGSVTTAGELAVTSTAQYMLLPSTATYTPGTGWTNLGNS